MRTAFTCYPCLVRQAVQSAARATTDTGVQREIVDAVLRHLLDLDHRTSPPQVAQATHRLLRKHTNGTDLFAAEKQEYNQRALDMLPRLRTAVEEATDPFEMAVRLAIAGNVIDFGAHQSGFDLDAEVETAMTTELRADAVADLRQAIGAAGTILFLGDNAGEIVFDRLFLETLLPLTTAETTYVVRGAPILNDATLDDAHAVGLPEIVRVIDNGSDAPGTVLDEVHPEVRALFSNADLVIAKGQGNYETLSDAPRPVFFLFKVKCPVVAEDVGLEMGQPVLARGN
jgi:uncharacterized protein with ATP-grasp and redox domains